MPLSSKKIIEFINAKDNSFTSNQLVDFFVSGKSAKLRKSGKRKGKNERASGTGEHKDIRRIQETLNVLELIGYVSRKNNSFSRSKNFESTAVFKSGKKGDGIAELPLLEILIDKKNTLNAHSGDTVKVIITDYRHNEFFGRVTKILQRSKESYLARKIKSQGEYSILELLDTPGYPNVIAKGSVHPKSILKIELTGNTISSLPEAEIISVAVSDPDKFDFERVVLRHRLPDQYDNIFREEDFISALSENEISNRKDFTEIYTVTIDGETAKDFDDAVSLRKNPGGYTLYVHIADVSAYIEKNSFLDREALNRGNSYYLGNRVIPMLPEVLSNNLCSLVPHKERFTLSAVMDYDLNGRIKKSFFTRGKILSNRRLTYNLADKILDEQMKTDESFELLTGLYEFTQILKQRRIENGRIDLNLSDNVLVYEDDKFKNIQPAKRLKSHSIIEECMLSANEIVSKAIKDSKIPSLYRIHEDMSAENIVKLKKFLNSLGIGVKKQKEIDKTLQDIISSVKSREYEQVVNFIILKSMMQAYYDVEPLGHFGLGFEDYTHFTSPIRRYPDLIVHRCLKTLIDSSKPIYTKEELSIIGEKTSKTERFAQKAERDLYKIKSCRIMEEHIGEVFEGIISSIASFGIYVSLDKIPVEGMIPLKLLTDDFYLVKEDDFTVIGRRHGKRFILGDRIMVKVIRSDYVSMQIDFEYINLL